MLKDGSQGRRKAEMSRIPSNSRVIAYLPSFKTIVQRLRATSATPSSLQLGQARMPRPVTQILVVEGIDKEQVHKESKRQAHCHDVLVTPLSSLTSQLSLPSSSHLFSSHASAASPLATPTLLSHMTMPLPASDQDTSESSALKQEESYETHEEEEEDRELALQSVFTGIRNKPDGTVECVVQVVPEFLVAGLLRLFPGIDLKGEDKLSVIVLSQRTVNDMTSWSEEVEDERQQLLEYFIDSAKEVCSRLNGANHWADFIDPSSGRAYYSPYSSFTLYETDDRYRYLGEFDIIDLGCCKCIQHPFWGSFAFVGSIFTTAPLNSPAIRSIIEL